MNTHTHMPALPKAYPPLDGGPGAPARAAASAARTAALELVRV
jgi:hypothetical protein